MLPKDPYSFFGSDFGICVSQNQRKFEDQSFIIEIKKLSALINDQLGLGTMINAYGKNPSKARPWLLAGAIHFIL